MAIDDNTSYELTGAQVKDLANKIKAKAADNIFVGATSAAPGSKGLVPQPQAGDNTKFLAGDGTWKAAGGASVTYYIADGDPNYPAPLQNNFVYEDSARTIPASAGDVYADMQAGKTVFFEYRTGMSLSSDTRITIFALSSMTQKKDTLMSDLYDYYGSMTAYMDSYANSSPTTIGFDVTGTEPRAWNFHAATIPTVNNGTLTIQHNGTNVQTFTANSSTNKTANIETIYADDAIDTSAITPFVTNSMIDWSTFAIGGAANAGSAQIGPLLIQWGRDSVSLNSSTPTESGKAITFGKAYTYTPFITIENEDISGVCGEFNAANNATVNGFTATIGRALAGGSGTVYFKWMAVGISTS